MHCVKLVKISFCCPQCNKLQRIVGLSGYCQSKKALKPLKLFFATNVALQKQFLADVYIIL